MATNSSTFVYINETRYAVDTEEQSDSVNELMNELGIDELSVYNTRGFMTGELFVRD